VNQEQKVEFQVLNLLWEHQQQDYQVLFQPALAEFQGQFKLNSIWRLQ
jgi:hypothetical protein